MQDISSLSKEELIALLSKKEQENIKLHQRLTEEKALRTDAEHENAVYRKKSVFVFNELAVFMSELRLAGTEILGLMDPDMEEKLRGILRTAADEYKALLNNRKNLLHQAFSNSKSEKIPTEKEFDEAGKAALAAASLHNNSRVLESTLRQLENAVKSLPAEGSDAQKAMQKIANIAVPNRSKTSGLRLGRQRTDTGLKTKTVYQKEKHAVCRGCGSSDLIPVGELLEKFKTSCAKGEEYYRILESHSDLSVCRRCGRAHIGLKEDADHPLIGNRSIGVAPLLEAADLVVKGIPLAKVGAALKDAFRLGNDTLSYSLNDLVKIYLKPLADLIEAQAKKEEVLLADETYLPVLEARGQGVRGKTTKAEKKSKNMVLAISSGPLSERPFFLYKYLHARGSEAISGIITPDYTFRTLVTDAYAGYNRVLEQHPEALHQSCLIHWRRKLLQACLDRQLCEDFDKLTPEQQEMVTAAQLQTDNPRAGLLMCLDAIRKIYRLRSEETPETSGESRRLQRELMDQIGVIIRCCAQDRVRKKGNRYESRLKSDLVGAACCYYLNAEADLRRFLDDPAVPCDTNQVEASIRAVAVIRKNIEYKQTIEYAESLYVMLTVFKTLKANGVKDPVAWLRLYCRALYLHIHESAWTPALKDGKDPSKKMDSYDVKELVKGFDFARWNPWNSAEA
jgi:hypothetical protein